MPSVLLYFPADWLASGMSAPRKARSNAPWINGKFVKKSPSAAFEDRRLLSEDFLQRLTVRRPKKKMVLNPDRGRMEQVTETITAHPYILPSSVRKHPLNRHVFDEEGELKPREQWTDPPGTPEQGRQIERRPFADSAHPGEHAVVHPGDLAAQQALDISRMEAQAEMKQDAAAALAEHLEAKQNEERDELAETAGEPDPDYDPHHAEEAAPSRKRSVGRRSRKED